MEIFQYENIIENAIIIFLENKKRWENYIGKETKKSEEGHKASYDTLNKEEYMDMKLENATGIEIEEVIKEKSQENQKKYCDRKKFKKGFDIGDKSIILRHT